jgi:8-oxo-dGTP diphosphatase
MSLSTPTTGLEQASDSPGANMNEGRTHPIVLVAAVALLNRDGKVLIARRPPGRPLAGLWEFPGGKVEAGEEPETALIREILEELGIEIARADLVPLTFASHAYPEFHLLMPLYLCKRWLGSIVAQEDQELRWVKPNELSLYDMAPADEPLKTTLPKLF